MTDNELAIHLSIDDKEILFAEYLMSKMPQAQYETRHIFNDGIYTRELHIPEGTFAIGMDHVKDNILNIVVKGSCSFIDGEGVLKTIKAPFTFVSKSGKKKVGYFHEDTIWLNVHRTDTLTVEDAEKELLIKSDFSIIQDQIDHYEALCEIGIPFNEVQVQVEEINDLIDIDMNLFGVYTKPSDIHGVGLFTNKPIEKDSPIAPAQICGFRTVAGRYTNHAKTPNAIMSYLDDHSIHLVSLREIQEHEEITIDYRQSIKLLRGSLCQQ